MKNRQKYAQNVAPQEQNAIGQDCQNVIAFLGSSGRDVQLCARERWVLEWDQLGW